MTDLWRHQSFNVTSKDDDVISPSKLTESKVTLYLWGLSTCTENRDCHHFHNFRNFSVTLILFQVPVFYHPPHPP